MIMICYYSCEWFVDGDGDLCVMIGGEKWILLFFKSSLNMYMFKKGGKDEIWKY